MSPELLLDLRRVNVIEHALVSVSLVDLDLVDGHGVQEGRDNLPSEVNGAGGIHHVHFVEPASVVLGYSLGRPLDGANGDIRDSHSSQVIDHNPVLDLPRDEALIDDLLMNVESGLEGDIHFFLVEQSGVNHQNGPKVLVPTARIEESLVLHHLSSTMRVSATDRSAGMCKFLN